MGDFMDFDALSERAASIGSAVAKEGPDALFDELDRLLPEPWKAQIANFPITAVSLALGVGVFLGLKKGDVIIAAGTALLTAAATENFSKFVGTQEA